jgi:hypothetical protein
MLYTAAAPWFAGAPGSPRPRRRLAAAPWCGTRAHARQASGAPAPLVLCGAAAEPTPAPLLLCLFVCLSVCLARSPAHPSPPPAPLHNVCLPRAPLPPRRRGSCAVRPAAPRAHAPTRIRPLARRAAAPSCAVSFDPPPHRRRPRPAPRARLAAVPPAAKSPGRGAPARPKPCPVISPPSPGLGAGARAGALYQLHDGSTAPPLRLLSLPRSSAPPPAPSVLHPLPRRRFAPLACRAAPSCTHCPSPPLRPPGPGAARQAACRAREDGCALPAAKAGAPPSLQGLRRTCCKIVDPEDAAPPG